MALIQEKFTEGGQFYEQAFQSFDKPFALDINNAFHCSVILEDYEKSANYARKLIRLGCNMRFFLEQESIKTFKKSPFWKKVVDDYPTLSGEFSKNSNWELRRQLGSLLGRDQYWRGIDKGYEHPASTFHEDSLIMVELLEIFQKEGYLNEYDTGVYIRDDTTLTDSPLPLILLHNYSFHKDSKKGLDLTELLKKFVFEGELPVDVFTFLNDRSGKYMIGKGFARSDCIWKMKGVYYYEKMSVENIKEIDERREDFYLCSVDQMRTKAYFQLKKGRFSFFSFSYVSSIDLPEEMVKSFFVPID